VQRSLPAKPHLDHLKSQAKDLLDAHRRREPEAFTRIRASVPAFAGMSDDALAQATFALHDAQSAIAREYGFVSWAELRAHVSAVTAEPAADAPPAEPAATAQSAADVQLTAFAVATRMAPAMVARLRAALAQRGSAASVPTPERVPMLPLRNAVVFPGAVIPIDVSRPTTLRGLEAALQHQPAFLAIFAQRASETEHPTQDDLHPTGCLCTLLLLQPAEGGIQTHAIVEGVRWVTLEALERVDPYYEVRVADVAAVDRGDAEALAVLDRRLRDTAREVAAAMPQIRVQALALIERTPDPGQLADLVMANFPASVAESATYATEPQLARRVERAIAALDGQLAKVRAPA
jgi:Lon protease-like protein